MSPRVRPPPEIARFYAAARASRVNPSLKNVPLAAVTPFAMPGDRERAALDAGCNGSIGKPINPGTFRSRIEELLKARTAGGETPP
jgi:CheY-like chemotaxis protein